MPRLEQFDWVTRWVFDENLFAAWPFDRFASELGALSFEFGNGSLDVFDFKDQSIPAAAWG